MPAPVTTPRVRPSGTGSDAHRSIRARLARSVAVVTVAVVTMATLGACIPGGETATSPTSELRLYTGPIPEPAPLAASGAFSGGIALPTMPEPPTDFTDEAAMEEYQRALEEYIAQMEEATPDASEVGDAVAFATQVEQLVAATRNSDEASVAAWQSLLVAAGIAVGYGDDVVEVSGMEGAGIPMTSAELRLHAVLGATTASMRLTELADIIEAYGVFGDADLTEALHTDLVNLSATDFGAVFFALNPDTFGAPTWSGYLTKDPSDVTLTGGQVGLVLRKISIDLLNVAEDHGGIDTASWNNSGSHSPSVTTALASHRTTTASGGSNPCGIEEEAWELEARKNTGKGLGVAFGAVFGHFLDTTSIGHASRLAASAALAGLALGTLATKMFSTEAQFSMGDSPLVRTKDRSAGSSRNIVVSLGLPPALADEIRNCTSMILAPLGIDVADKTVGALAGVDVNLMLKGTRLQYGTQNSGTDVYHQQTSVNGTAIFPVEGKPQRERLPQGAEPEDVSSLVQADANIDGADLVKDLTAAGWDALGPGVAGILGNIASRMKLLSFTWEAPVRDWKLDAEFDMVLSGTLWAHSAINRGGTSEAPCGTWIMNESATASGTLESIKPQRVVVQYLAEDVDGSPVGAVLMHTKGIDEYQLYEIDNAIQVAHVQANYDLTKSESSPGLEPMPDHFEESEVGGCADGQPGASVPQADCGARDLAGAVSVNVRDGIYFLTADSPNGNAWNYCGIQTHPRDPLSPPVELSACANAEVGGGEMPSLDSIFNPRGWFEVTGSLDCARDGDGTLQRFSFEWTMKFCRVVDGKSEGCTA